MKEKSVLHNKPNNINKLLCPDAYKLYKDCNIKILFSSNIEKNHLVTFNKTPTVFIQLYKYIKIQ